MDCLQSSELAVGNHESFSSARASAEVLVAEPWARKNEKESDKIQERWAEGAILRRNQRNLWEGSRGDY